MTEPVKKFEYEITRHPAAAFKEVVIFCSQEGACNFESVPVDQVARLAEILN